MDKTFFVFIIYIICLHSVIYGQDDVPVDTINITGKIVSSDYESISGIPETEYFGDDKNFTDEINGQNGAKWQLFKKLRISNSGNMYLITTYLREGYDAAIIIYEERSGVYERIGGYANFFGGNGVVIEVISIDFKTNKLEIGIQVVGYFNNPIQDEDVDEAPVYTKDMILVVDIE
ncbi:MAG: hypothetical protein JXB49_00460 [Bacteroidales bacterium]|nr:hypothetical protein [Bacteroidales bacterium]